MKLTVELAGKLRIVELARTQQGFACSIDGAPVAADIVQINPYVYSILIAGRCFEARVEPEAGDPRIFASGREYSAAVRDPREWRRKHGGGVESSGRQQVLAPMPGKVVRILAKIGEAIEAGQGVIVVEAMKMQNEVRAPKSGRIERILVAEGQSVNAGEVLALVV